MCPIFGRFIFMCPIFEKHVPDFFFANENVFCVKIGGDEFLVFFSLWFVIYSAKNVKVA
jgi:hypothetical protein